MKNKELLKKLKDYSLLAAAGTAVTSVQGQIVYTDINPDAIVNSNGTYDIDLNNDLTKDIRINVNHSSSVSATTSFAFSFSTNSASASNLNSASVVLSTSSYAAAMSNGALISNANNWAISGSMGTFSRFFFSSTGSVSSSSSSNGAWGGQKNKYLGIMVKVGSDTLYGWARMDVALTYSSATIKDYGYQSFPGVPIKAGDTTHIDAPMATNVLGADVANNGNGLDLQISFNKPASEVGIKEYRIYIVDSAKAGTFNIDSAKAVASGDYIVHKPNGANYSSTQQATTTDVDGNLIVNNQPYNIFVLSVPDGANKNNPVMTKASPVVTLHTVTGIADLADNKFKAYAGNGKIIIESAVSFTGKQYAIFNNAGQQVLNGKLLSSREIVSTAGLVQGIYHVRILDGDVLQGVTKVFVR